MSTLDLQIISIATKIIDTSTFNKSQIINPIAVMSSLLLLPVWYEIEVIILKGQAHN